MTLPLFRAAILAIVTDPNQPDLTARQTAVLLAAVLEPTPQTVRGLAAAMNVAKPAITRALDRLEELDLARRVRDPADRRSVMIHAAPAGKRLLRRIERAMIGAEVPA